jgi:2-polyprenyl-6-methoxyphenol hydroxylase-like FAD-dependent oxidoreductase
MRMIIVGAGPAGLFLAHALTRLGMTDFVILEKRQSLDEESGNGLGLWPQSVRVLDQLGLLEAAQSVSEPLKRNIHLDSRGTLLAEEAFFTVVEKKFVSSPDSIPYEKLALMSFNLAMGILLSSSNVRNYSNCCMITFLNYQTRS